MTIHTFHQISSLHFTSHQFTPLHFNKLHITLHHFTTLPITSHHFTTLHITSLHFTSHHFTTLHITSHHFTTLHITSLHITSLHFTSLHYTSLPFFHSRKLLDVSSPPFKNPSLHGPHSSTLVICVVRLLFVLFYVLFVCKCVLPPGDNPNAVNRHIIYHS